MTICETSIELIKETNFVTYVNYCRCIGASLRARKLSQLEKAHIVKIFDVLEKIYSLNETELGNYIYDYFNLDSEHINKFERVVRMTKEYYVTGV